MPDEFDLERRLARWSYEDAYQVWRVAHNAVETAGIATGGYAETMNAYLLRSGCGWTFSEILTERKRRRDERGRYDDPYVSPPDRRSNAG